MLKATYNRTATQVAQILKNIGLRVTTVISVLNNLFTLTVTTLRDILLSVGYSICEVLLGLGLPAPGCV